MENCTSIAFALVTVVVLLATSTLVFVVLWRRERTLRAQSERDKRMFCDLFRATIPNIDHDSLGRATEAINVLSAAIQATIDRHTSSR